MHIYEWLSAWRTLFLVRFSIICSFSGTMITNYKGFIIIWVLDNNGDDEVTEYKQYKKGNSNSFT